MATLKRLESIKISFFENIIYWFWVYSLKFKAMYPWSFARIVTSILKSSNAVFIALIVFKIINIENSEDAEGFAIISLCAVIIIADMVIYDSRIYCVLKNKYGEVWDEKYCILKKKYDSLSQSTRKKRKLFFYLYLMITVSVNAILGLYLYNN
jgi:hypothetical protein